MNFYALAVAFLCLLGAGFIAYCVLTATPGEEDESGFHFKKPEDKDESN